jgi:hypothetical protein
MKTMLQYFESEVKKNLDQHRYYWYGENMTHKITARWVGVSLAGFIHTKDIIEIDNRYYSIVDQDLDNNYLEREWVKEPYLLEHSSTVEAITALNDPMGVLKVIQNRNPDWVCFEYYQIFCECGSDKVYGPNNCCHDRWCPKYEGGL